MNTAQAQADGDDDNGATQTPDQASQASVVGASGEPGSEKEDLSLLRMGDELLVIRLVGAQSFEFVQTEPIEWTDGMFEEFQALDTEQKQTVLERVVGGTTLYSAMKAVQSVPVAGPGTETVSE